MSAALMFNMLTLVNMNNTSTAFINLDVNFNILLIYHSNQKLCFLTLINTLWTNMNGKTTDSKCHGKSNLLHLTFSYMEIVYFLLFINSSGS